MAKVRANNIILDSESLEAVDGALSSNEVLQVKLDPVGGLVKGVDGLGLAASLDAPPSEGIKFAYDLVDPNLSSVEVYLVGSGVPQIVMPYSGRLRSLAVRISAAPSAGGVSCILVKPTINGTPLVGSTFDCTFDSGGAALNSYQVDLTGSETFSAGDTLGLVLTTAAGLLPTNIMLLADLVVIGD